MAKYFCGITAEENKYTVTILDDNLNIIFIDSIDLNRLVELLRRKSISIISIDAPTVLYLKQSDAFNGEYPEKIVIRKRSLDDNIASKNLFTYSDCFNVTKSKFESIVKLSRQLNKLGFQTRVPGESEKSIVESHPNTAFLAMGCNINSNLSSEYTVKKKIEHLRSKGIRMNNLLKRMKQNIHGGIDTLCLAYTAYLYHSGDITCFGSQEEGLLILPVKGLLSETKTRDLLQKNNSTPARGSERILPSTATSNRGKETKVITEYCGAQYLYTNTDGIIRIDGLRPIKSYRPFTDIYEVKNIRMVQVIIGTTDGLRKVKAYLIPSQENSNSFRAANEEDKKKLDSFWGVHGDKRGYLIKFNRVDRVDIAQA